MKSTDDRSLFPALIGSGAASGNIATIPATQAKPGDGTASIAQGFPAETFIDRAAGGEPPRGADMNGFLWLLSHAVQALQSGYLGQFNPTFAQAIGGYPAGAIVSGASVGTFWVSTADNNTSAPGADGTAWKSLFDGLATQMWANGVFSTIAALNAETLRATTIESNLQGSKVNRSGDTMTGGLTINSWNGLVAGAAPSSAPNGARINYPAFNSVANGRGGVLSIQLKEDVGSRFLATIGLTSDQKAWRTVDIPQRARINDSDYGDVAYVSDLGNYVPSSVYSSDFLTGDSRVINLPYGHQIQFFTAYIGSNGTNSHRVTYPVAFSGAATPVFSINDTGQSRSVSLSNNSAPDATGFDIAVSVHGNSTGPDIGGLTLTVIAAGPR